MSVLTRDAILQALADGEIGIDPFDPTCVGPASVDLHLASTFRVFRAAHRTVRIEDGSDYRDYSEVRVLAEGETLLLMPGHTILGLTRERIRLSPRLCGRLEGRSRFARVGLLVHISASFMQPGIDNHQVLEMSNFGANPLELVPGTAICQFIFERTVGEASYTGRFAGQTPESW
jgi:dCTP deaminase